ncbi:ferritin [Jeotgalibacillus sp. ET6]|uniref:ferritin n=1 Tax=Jeotgalibacillus sp. ET6 TaxID=3037260 RepID=UPI002418AA0A|nr:ferritin [Jeotgalibacillus sp. ET6]MDG5470535.1 ferritin [Jeotgalibacillus sp. ET6]
MLNEQIQKLLNNLISIEHLSTTLYLAMSAYMASKNFTGMSSWLNFQSAEERTHLLKLIKYVTDRGGTVEIQTIPAQPTNFGSPSETFTAVLEHERYVTNAYRQAVEFSTQLDQQTAAFLQDFLIEQIDEEAQALTIVDRLNLAQNNPSALILIDQELGQRAVV